MKKYMKTKCLLVLLAGAFSLCSCERWLQVKMEDQILENSLYENLEGFTTALNGIYASLNQDAIYGRNLSMGAIDVMAQYYDVLTPENHAMAVYGEYEFAQSSYKSLFSSVWRQMYSLLANVNLLIENCEQASSSQLPGVMRNLVTGEAYALRGMLHFDLLRLYGPVYREDTKSTRVMPYMIRADRKIRPLLSADSVLALCIGDLEYAASLLKEVDPVIEEGPKNGSSAEDANNDLNYRQYRLNYYAVQALLARAYLWGGNQLSAVNAAKEVLAVSGGSDTWFPFTSRSDVLKESNPNLIFSTEVLFGLYNTSRTTIYEGYFQRSASSTSRLTLFGTYDDGRLRTMYPNENDVRFSLWENSMVDTTEVLYFRKYEAVEDAANRYMIPLIRISEIYLLLAECATDNEDVAGYLNALRNARGTVDVSVTAETKDQLIAEEFAREMIGEGQLYLFYKRKGMEFIPNGKSKEDYMEMPLSNYVWNLPDTEVENRTDI